MKKGKDLIEIFILGGILSALVIFLFMTGYKIKKDDDKQNVNNEIVETPNIENNVIEEDKPIETNKPETNKNENKDQNNKQENNGLVESNKEAMKEDMEVITKDEQEIVTYMSNFNNDLDKYNQDDKTLLEKTKTGFITIVDFLFYDGKIKGYTFKELSFNAKIKVLKLAAIIDNKIDTKFPGYKETIKEKATNLKGKIAYLYLETTNKFCDKVSQEVCNTAREDFNSMKDNYSYTWETVKEVILASGGKLTTMLSEWYKNIK